MTLRFLQRGPMAAVPAVACPGTASLPNSGSFQHK